MTQSKTIHMCSGHRLSRPLSGSPEPLTPALTVDTVATDTSIWGIILPMLGIPDWAAPQPSPHIILTPTLHRPIREMWLQSRVLHPVRVPYGDLARLTGAVEALGYPVSFRLCGRDILRGALAPFCKPDSGYPTESSSHPPHFPGMANSLGPFAMGPGQVCYQNIVLVTFHRSSIATCDFATLDDFHRGYGYPAQNSERF